MAGQACLNVQRDVVQTVCASECLPTVPSVAMHVVTLCSDADVGFPELASCVSADTALAAKLLRMSNSVLFAGRTKVTTIRGALVRLGLKVTRIATLGFSIATETKDKAPAGFDIDRFWRHALTTASAARIVAQSIRLPKADDAFADGLLQDVGILAFQCTLPEEYGAVLEAQRAAPTRELHEIERETFGATHMDVGSEVLRTWRIPSEIHEPIRFHHCPEAAKAGGRSEATVEMARLLCLGAFIGRLFNDPAKGIMHETVIRMAEREFHLSEQATVIVLEKVESAVKETARIFSVEGESVSSYTEIQAQAGREIARIAIEMDAEVRHREAEIDEDEQKIRQLTQDNEELRTRATVDELTGLLVRREFVARFGKELSRSHRYDLGLGLLMIDVDRFKSVNDTYGHPAGDQILKELGRSLRDSIRQSDMAGRYGGEEFVVLLPQADIASTLEAAERLRLGIAEASKDWHEEIEGVTVSVGAVHCRPGSEKVTTGALFEQADQALYAAKSAGRNCTRYSSRE